MRKYYILFSIFLFLPSFKSIAFLSHGKDWLLDFKKEQILDSKLKFKGLLVGGLSGLAYDERTNVFYVLSDAKKNYRLYKLALRITPEYHFKILDQILLKDSKGNPLSRNMDPEDLVFYDENTVFITSEGQQIFKEHEPTSLFTFSLPSFSLKSVFPVAEMFWPKGEKKQKGNIGSQENKGFESLTLDRASKSLWTSTEKALFQDLKTERQVVLRLSEFDIKNQKLISQYLYPLEDQKTGLTAMIFLKEKSFLTLERKFDVPFLSVELFFTDCNLSNDVKNQITLEKKNRFCSKKKIWSSSELDFLVGNLEGMSLVEHSGKKILILVSDNNFKSFQKTHFLFFEISEKELKN
ncbi:MAG: esterase-like activity of phytase family protein [Bdellovibrionales bacterium]|nr:esterase-like activity of phytase family protein [Bdellovibrionales bacterium]